VYSDRTNVVHPAMLSYVMVVVGEAAAAAVGEGWRRRYLWESYDYRIWTKIWTWYTYIDSKKV